MIEMMFFSWDFGCVEGSVFGRGVGWEMVNVNFLANSGLV